MLPEIESLLVLQDRDHDIQTMLSEIEKIPRDAAAIKQRLDGSTTELDSAKKAIVENELAISKIDLDRKVRKDTIEKLNVQRFETKKNDEYAAIGAEITRYQDMVDVLETEELEYMEKTDALEATLSTAKERLANVKANMAIEVKELMEKKAQNTVRIEEVKADRANLVKDLDPSLISMYERVFAKKGNQTVAPLNENKCGGCHMKVIADVVSNTIAEKEVCQCNNCGCFLYSV